MIKNKSRIIDCAGKMPIGAYFGPFCSLERWPDMPDCLNDESYSLASGGGFTFMISYAERYPEKREEVFRALDFARKYGIKMILSDSNIEQGTIEYKLQKNGFIPDIEADYRRSIEDYGNHPAYLGCYIVDEHLPDRFALTKQIREVFDKVTPDKLFFVNMLPVYGISSLRNVFWIEDADERAAVYTEYVRKYLQTVEPPLFCYDLYPMQGDFPAICPDYYTNLAIARREALSAGVPFWFSVQSFVVDKAPGAQSYIRECGLAETIFQVNTSLAFGAKGFAYFCWSQPYDGMCGEEKHLLAITNRNGKPTALYGRAQTANAFAHKIGAELLECESLGVIITGSSPAPIPKYSHAEDKGVLNSVSGKHVLTGVLKAEEKYRYLAVNNSITERDTITFEFKNDKEFSYLTQNKDGFLQGSTITLELLPGEAVFLKEV